MFYFSFLLQYLCK